MLLFCAHLFDRRENTAGRFYFIATIVPIFEHCITVTFLLSCSGYRCAAVHTEGVKL